MKTIYLGMGSNIGDSHAHLAHAREQIAKCIGAITNVSSVYRTAPWGKTDQADFLNQVIEVCTELDPFQVLEALLAIERNTGRERREKWGARTLDLDLLFYADYRIQTQGLTVPHPRLVDRNFVLAPLAEIAPNLVHPGYNRTVVELLQSSPDHSEVSRLVDQL